MSKTWTRIEDYQSLVLCRGLGKEPESGLCVMQTVAWFAGEPLSDHPECASPVLAHFAIVVNDGLEQDQRQQLRKLVVGLSGSRADALERQRAEFLIVQVAQELLAPTLTEAERLRFARAVNCSEIAEALLNKASSRRGPHTPHGRRSMTLAARQLLKAIEQFEVAKGDGAIDEMSRAVADAAITGVMLDSEGGRLTSILERALRIGVEPEPAAASRTRSRDDRESVSGYEFLRKRKAPCPSPSSPASILEPACADYASSTGPGG